MNIKFQDRLEQNQSFDSVLNNRATKLRLVGNGSLGFLLYLGPCWLSVSPASCCGKKSLYSASYCHVSLQDLPWLLAVGFF